MIQPDYGPAVAADHTTSPSSTEEILLLRAFEVDPATDEPDMALSPIEEAIFACNQLIRVHQTWKAAGLNRDYAAIRRAGAIFTLFYKAEAELSEADRESEREAIGWGWDPGHVAALGIRQLLISRHQEVSGLSDEAMRAFYAQMGQNDLHYLSPKTSSR